MIVFMGSSFTRGGWGHPDEIFLSDIVQKESNYKVLNLASPCYGSEKYLSSFLFACEHYKPKLFFVETASDRSNCYFYVPNKIIKQILKCTPEEINRIFTTYGIQQHGQHDFRIHGFNSHNDKNVQKNMKTVDIPVKIKTILSSFNYTRLLTDSFEVRSYKTINNYVSLERLSKMSNIPVLYYSFEDLETLNAQPFVDNLPTDRFLNRFFNIEGVNKYANKKLNGKHLADECHHNHTADQLVVKDLIIPFIKNYDQKYNLNLEQIGSPIRI